MWIFKEWIFRHYSKQSNNQKMVCVGVFVLQEWGYLLSQILSNRIRGCSESSVPFTISFFLLWSPGGAVVKNPLANAGDSRHMGLNSWLGRSPGTGNGDPLQYSCLGNSRSEEPGVGYCPWDCKELYAINIYLLTCCSVADSCPMLCDPVDFSMTGFPVLHYLLEFVQTHIRWVGNAIQPSHPLLPPSPALSLSQHQGFFTSFFTNRELTSFSFFSQQLQWSLQ